jgi:group I intron endonuclease
MVTIYLLYNKVNGKEYLGQTKGLLERRWQQHVYSSSVGSKYPLHCAIRKHGPSSFELYKIGECVDKAQSGRVERILICSLRNYAGCYNATVGGEGGHDSPEFGRKISERQRGRKLSDETKRKIGEANRLKGVSNEEVVRLYASGLTMEDVAKQVGARTGKTIRDRLVASGVEIRHIPPWIGRKHTKATREKMRHAWDLRRQKETR